MNKTLIYLLLLIVTFGCSKDDSDPEFIVGQWKIIAQYIEGEEIEMHVCGKYIIYEFNSDFSFSTFLTSTDQIPNNIGCAGYPLGLYEWKKENSDVFVLSHKNIPTLIKTFTINGSSLIMTSSENENEFILVRR